MHKNIAVIGCGAAGLFLLKAFIEQEDTNSVLNIFEASDNFAVGMPYSKEWANVEHKSNIACQEFPEMLEEPHHWLMRQSSEFLADHRISRDQISELLVFPRITLGAYLQDQFSELLKIARQKRLQVNLHQKHKVNDIETLPNEKIRIHIEEGPQLEFDNVIIETGHEWPQRKENRITGYYDSPFPLKKLTGTFNHHVGLMGSSLTAVDAIKTLAKGHGQFLPADNNGALRYVPRSGTDNFKIILHSRRGLLPSIRFHFEYPRIQKYIYISKEEIENNIASNDGYLSLNYVFEKSYKDTIAEKDPALYAVIKNMSLEQFVEHMYTQIRSDKPFERFQEQLKISRRSEARREPIHWKEALDDTFYTLNFYAKYLSAEDMLRLRNHFMPLSYYIGAFLPFDSCEELLALHNAEKLDIVEVGYDSNITTNETECGATFHYKAKNGKDAHTHYETFIECTGQRQQPFEAFPFKTLVKQGIVSPARVKFLSAAAAEKLQTVPSGCRIEKEDDSYSLRLPGIRINDNFQPVGVEGNPAQRINIMSISHIKGMSPDFTGIPFCNDVSRMVFHAINDNKQALEERAVQVNLTL